MPVTSRAKRQESKFAEAGEELKKKSKNEKELRVLRTKSTKLKSSLATFDKRVPAKAQVPALLAEVLQSAGRNGLKIVSTSPKR